MSPIRRLPFLLILAACTGQDRGDYPQLLPLSQINQPPAVPAHAADAAADPQAVGAALDARRAEAAARATAMRAPVTDAAALGRRADDLQRRAGALAQTPMPQAAPQGEPAAALSPITASPAPADPAPPGAAGAAADKDDAVTAARAEALRERARALSGSPVTSAPRPSPAAPACAPDPTSCNP